MNLYYFLTAFLFFHDPNGTYNCSEGLIKLRTDFQNSDQSMSIDAIILGDDHRCQNIPYKYNTGTNYITLNQTDIGQCFDNKVDDLSLVYSSSKNTIDLKLSVFNKNYHCTMKQ